MANHDGVVAGGASKDTAIADVVLHVADNGTLRNGSEGEYVSDHKDGFATTVNELASVHPLGGNEEFFLQLKAKGVAEGDTGKWCAAAGVVDDLRHHALEVPVALPVVEAAEPSRPLTMVGVGLENRPRSLPLGTDYSSHPGG